jgi:fumarylpyruvate hydrolase
MNDFVFPASTAPSVAVAGTDKRFPMHRIYCVGRNQPDKAREIGAEPPVFFMRPADAEGTDSNYGPNFTPLAHLEEAV